MTGKTPDVSLSWRSLLTVDLNARSDRREILDDQASDHALVAPTLRNLEQINVMLSGIRRLCVKTIFRKPLRDPMKPLVIADLGCGGGDLALWLARQCANRSIRARIYGIDHDPRVVALAKNRCALEDTVTILQGDAADRDQLPDEVDWIVSNHLLHHLGSGAVTELLKQSSARARQGVVMNDLVRSRGSLVAFNLLCRLFAPSGCTEHDGMVSIMRSFTRRELYDFIETAGLSPRAVMYRSGIGHQAAIVRR